MAGVFAGHMGKQVGGVSPSQMGQNPDYYRGGRLDGQSGYPMAQWNPPKPPMQSMQGGGMKAQMPQGPQPGMNKYDRQMARQNAGQASRGPASMYRPPQQPSQPGGGVSNLMDQFRGQLGGGGGGGLGHMGMLGAGPGGQAPQGQGGFDQEAWLQKNSPGFRPPEMGQHPEQFGQGTNMGQMQQVNPNMMQGLMDKSQAWRSDPNIQAQKAASLAQAQADRAANPDDPRFRLENYAQQGGMQQPQGQSGYQGGGGLAASFMQPPQQMGGGLGNFQPPQPIQRPPQQMPPQQMQQMQAWQRQMNPASAYDF